MDVESFVNIESYVDIESFAEDILCDSEELVAGGFVELHHGYLLSLLEVRFVP